MHSVCEWKKRKNERANVCIYVFSDDDDDDDNKEAVLRITDGAQTCACDSFVFFFLCCLLIFSLFTFCISSYFLVHSISTVNFSFYILMRRLLSPLLTSLCVFRIYMFPLKLFFYASFILA